MKAFFSFTLLSSLAGAAQAQTSIKAGTIQLGGNVGYARTSQETPVSNGYGSSVKATTIDNQFIVAPSVGFFVADNLAVGISGTYQLIGHEYKDLPGMPSYKEKIKQFRIGAFIQYYKMVSEQFGFTGTLGGGYQYWGQPYNYGTDNIGTKGAYANLTPSIVFFPVPKLAIGASIGGLNYLYSTYESNSGGNSSNSYESSSFAADFGLSQLQFSGTYYFGR